MKGAPHHLISLVDLTDEELCHLVERGRDYSMGTILPTNQLGGRVIAIYFRKTSTRTRTAFTSGALRLGASIITFGPDDLQLSTGEPVEDTTRVLSRMVDALVARTSGSETELRALSAQERMAVINALSADEHPTQALADLTTMLLRFGGLEGLRVLYIGEGNSTAVALSLGLARFAHTELHVRTPPGYGLDAGRYAVALACAEQHGSIVTERHDVCDLPREIDVVYTTQWETTGTTKVDPDWRSVFEPFRVNEALMERYPRAVFMHDLPARRGQEVQAGVLDGPSSIAFDQAANKLYSAMAVMEWCLEDQ